MSGRQLLGTAAAVILMASGAAAARTTVQAQPPDILPALLAEVKGLRAAMEQMSSAGPRVQLSVGRLQLQEGRINGMIRRLDTVRDTLASAKRELEGLKGAQKMMGGDDNGKSSAQKEDFGLLLAGMAKQTAAAQANVDRLAAEEQQLASDLAIEQGRWVEINQRLDELERALAGKR